MWTESLWIAALGALASVSTAPGELSSSAAETAARPSAPAETGTSPRTSDAHASQATESPSTWNAARAARLLSRAGFGATADEVREAVAAGEERTIARLFEDHGPANPPEILGQSTLHGGLVSPGTMHARLDARRAGYLELQSDYFAPLNAYGVTWVENMLAARAPVRDRMALFWHGHLVSSFKEVGDSYEMIGQIRFLRGHALGPFGDLLRGIARDPAMLQYLSNAKNVKAHPNENWARELMELFTLGDGNYTETDVKEAARAFTGWSKTHSGFVFHRLQHDYGQKTVLGVTGDLDGDDVLGILLAQPACARWIAGKLIASFEGQAPDPARLEEYAAVLRASGYDIEGCLRKLFADPRFYRDEIAGARVEPPTEYLISTARRLELVPPGEMCLAAGGVLGQRLFFPPSVKGWEGGMSWITTSSIMQRSNMAGVMLGLVGIDELLGTPAAADEKPLAENNQARTSNFGMLHHIQSRGWKPKLSLFDRVAAHYPGEKDADLVRHLCLELLVVPADPATLSTLESWLRDERAKLAVPEGALGAHSAAGTAGDAAQEELLRRLAHLILSLPEAQLD